MITQGLGTGMITSGFGVLDDTYYDEGAPTQPVTPVYGGGYQLWREPELTTPISVEQDFHGMMKRLISATAFIHGIEVQGLQQSFLLGGRNLTRTKRDITLLGKLKQAISHEVKLSGILTRQVMHEQALKAQMIRAVSSETQFTMTSLEPIDVRILRDLLFMNIMED